jgi:hypothetical protein
MMSTICIRHSHRWACSKILAYFGDTKPLIDKLCPNVRRQVLLQKPYPLKKKCCLLLIDKARAKDKIYIWLSVTRCDERLKPKDEESTWLTYTGFLEELEYLKIETRLIDENRDEVNRREVCECDGWVCDLDMMDTPSKLSVIREAASLLSETRPGQPCFWAGQRKPRGGSGTGHGRFAEAELLKLQKSGQFPDESVRIKVWQIHYVTSQTY